MDLNGSGREMNELMEMATVGTFLVLIIGIFLKQASTASRITTILENHKEMHDHHFDMHHKHENLLSRHSSQLAVHEDRFKKL